MLMQIKDRADVWQFRSAVDDVDVGVDRGPDPARASDPADPRVGDAVLAELDDTFDALSSADGRRSVRLRRC
jgi:hypothetical protein